MAEKDSKEAITAKIIVYSNGDEECLSLISKDIQLKIISHISVCLIVV
jgi:hypothetical protein